MWLVVDPEFNFLTRADHPHDLQSHHNVRQVGKGLPEIPIYYNHIATPFTT